MVSAESLRDSGLQGSFSQRYFYQDWQNASRYHLHHLRETLSYGLGGILEISAASNQYLRRREAAPADSALTLLSQVEDWNPLLPEWGGLGDSDLSLRLRLPLPMESIHFAVEGHWLISTGNPDSGTGSDSEDREFLASASWKLPTARNFPETWLHLQAGFRLRDSSRAWGTPVADDPEGPWPVFHFFHPSSPDGESELQRQELLGLALDFRGSDGMRLFGELVWEGYDPQEGMALQENLWQLALGFRLPVNEKWRSWAVFDLCLSQDDLETAFEPHYPRLAVTLGIER